MVTVVVATGVAKASEAPTQQAMATGVGSYPYWIAIGIATLESIDTREPLLIKLEIIHPATRKTATIILGLVNEVPNVFTRKSITRAPAPDLTNPSAIAKAAPNVINAGHIIFLNSLRASTQPNSITSTAPLTAIKPRSHLKGLTINKMTHVRKTIIANIPCL